VLLSTAAHTRAKHPGRWRRRCWCLAARPQAQPPPAIEPSVQPTNGVMHKLHEPLLAPSPPTPAVCVRERSIGGGHVFVVCGHGCPLLSFPPMWVGGCALLGPACLLACFACCVAACLLRAWARCIALPGRKATLRSMAAAGPAIAARPLPPANSPARPSPAHASPSPAASASQPVARQPATRDATQCANPSPHPPRRTAIRLAPVPGYSIGSAPDRNNNLKSNP